jgi:membrane-anchored glycerophosphoryl diester phosphodiesterase (GDPDase)
MAKGKHQTYPEKERDGEISRLKNANKRLKSENEKLKAEIKTYEAAFQKNIYFLKGKTKDLSLQELLDGAKKEQSLKSIEDKKEMTFKDMESKWKCFKCGTGVMRIIMFNKLNEKWYLRKCSFCENRTNAQKLDDNVEVF